jgi:hypothetical protein
VSSTFIDAKTHILNIDDTAQWDTENTPLLKRKYQKLDGSATTLE